MAGHADAEIVHLFRQEAHRQRLLSMFFDHGEQFAALARDLDAAADRIECNRNPSQGEAVASFEIEPREVEYFVCTLPPREELIYRLAVRALSARCRGDRQFRQRTETLVLQFGQDLPAVLVEADKLSAELAASVSRR